MKTRIIRPAVAALCALAGALLFAACKESTIIQGNQNIVPDDLTPSMVITDIDTRTVHDDSIITSGMGLPIYHAIGRMNADPYSGEVNASVFVQFLPPVTGWKVPTGYALDSVVAVFPYSGFIWGDTNSFTNQLSYQAFAIDNGETFTMDGTYYAFSDLKVGTPVVGTGSLQSYNRLKNTVVVGKDTVPAHLRIRADAILPALQAAIADDNSYTSFLSHFKGLLVAPAPNNPFPTSGVLPYFRLANTTTAAYAGASLQVYAHNGTNVADDTAFTFPFNPTYAGHFNRVRRDTVASFFNLYGAELAASKLSPSRPQMYLHYEPGGAMDVTIKGIQSIPQGIINRAELVITLDETVPSINNFFPPPRIYPIGIDIATGGQYNVKDREPLAQQEPLVFIDGTLRTESNGSRAYHLNIPREIQRVKTAGGDQLRLKITGLQTYPGAYRVVVHGNDASANRIRLNIVFTRQL